MKNRKIKPPILADWLLKRFAKYDEDKSINGDFDEEYCEFFQEKGKVAARLWYWLQLFRSLPFLITDSIYWSYTMFTNYFKIAFRNLRQNNFLSAITIFSLVIGFTFCILTFLYIHNEFTYDKFHEDAEQLFRVYYQKDTEKIGIYKSTAVPAPLGKVLVEDVPGIINMTRLYSVGADYVISNGDGFFREKLLFADESFFSIFTFPFKYGNPETALKMKNSIVLSQTMAVKFFGNENPLGRILSIKHPGKKEYLPFLVSGVVENIPVL